MESRNCQLKGKCFICLRAEDTIKNCKVEKPCFHCAQVKNHHRSLCPRTVGKEIPQQSSSTPLSYGKKVIMQTATIVVSNKVIHIPTIKTRILMDTGSQRANVPEEIVQQLQLSPSARENYAMFTYVSSKPKQISTPLVVFNLKLNKGRSLTITASVIPKISGEILRSPLDNASIKKLKGYKLADTPPLQDESSEIGILIGNDHYGEILMSKKIEIDKGLYLLGSTRVKTMMDPVWTNQHKENPNYTMTVFTLITSRVKNQINNNLTMETALPSYTPMEDWCLEAIGITDNPRQSDDEKAV